MTQVVDIPPPAGESVHALEPTAAQFQTTSRCNGGCIICPYPRTSRELPQGKMTWELVERVIDEIASVPTIRAITPMLQNEPLLDRRLEDVIRRIKSARPDAVVGINTNGLLLDRERLFSLADAGLDNLIFSLNAFTKETFSVVQPGLSFKTVVSNLDSLIENRPEGMNVAVKAMIVRDNLVEMAAPTMFSDLTARLKKAGIPFGADAISNRAGALDGYDEMLVMEQTQSSKQRLWCRDPFDAINVLFNGDMIICCADWSRASTFGNLAERSLRDIWNSSEMRAYRQMVVDQTYDRVAPCRTCSQAQNILANLRENSA